MFLAIKSRIGAELSCGLVLVLRLSCRYAMCRLRRHRDLPLELLSLGVDARSRYLTKHIQSKARH